MTAVRNDGRRQDQIRPILIQYDVYGYADASVLFEQGNTKVLVGITLQQTVPPFLKGQKTGWLSAEYAMLPHATQQRTTRESTQNNRNARSVEISRLIGRCLRPTVDLVALGERSIMIDCDVLQADGGTRVACISAASAALRLAVTRWVSMGVLDKNIFKESIAALSIGIVNQQALVDLDYSEDSQADADFNVVLTENGKLIEIQGTSEKNAISWDLFDQIKKHAQDGIAAVLKAIQNTPMPTVIPSNVSPTRSSFQRPALFSLANRLQK